MRRRMRRKKTRKEIRLFNLTNNRCINFKNLLLRRTRFLSFCQSQSSLFSSCLSLLAIILSEKQIKKKQFFPLKTQKLQNLTKNNKILRKSIIMAPQQKQAIILSHKQQIMRIRSRNKLTNIHFTMRWQVQAKNREKQVMRRKKR